MKYAMPVTAVGRKLALPMAACLLLGACATEPEYQVAIKAPVVPAVAQQPPAVLPAQRLAPLPAAAQMETITPLYYYEWAMAATPQELTAERLRLAARQDSPDPVIDAVRLGILMSLSALRSADSEQVAITMLESLEDPALSAAGREYVIFAGFLLDHLHQREDLRAATSSIVDSREALETLERNNLLLQEKIEALTRIEEQLIEREQAEVQAETQLDGVQR